MVGQGLVTVDRTAGDRAPPVFVHKTYDKTARARIRDALRRYRKQEKIKQLTKLANRIATANGRKNKINREFVSRRTLARFLNEEHEVDDDYVNYCEVFLNSVAPAGSETELGTAMAAFLPDLRGREELERQFQGDYIARIRALRTRPLQPASGFEGQPPAMIGPVTAAQIAGQQPGFKMPWSILTLEAMPYGGFLRVTEFLRDPEQEAEQTHPPPNAQWRGNTGIFVSCGGGEYLIMVRSFLAARFYFLCRASDEPLILRGTVFQSNGPLRVPLLLSAAASWQPVFEIEMLRGAECAPSADG